MRGRRNGLRRAGQRTRSGLRQPRLEALEERQLLATFTVTNAADNGDNVEPIAGSLRAAIIDANRLGGLDTIAFDIGGGGLQTIVIIGALPTITDPVIIDGTTQSGYTGNTPLIEIRGRGPLIDPMADGLRLTNGSTVRALTINNFAQAGIRISGGNNRIERSFIGTDSLGEGALPNGLAGIRIEGSGNIIGSTEAGQGNVISGNAGPGIDLSGNSASNNRIFGNIIGLDRSGTQSLGNADEGISIFSGRDNLIGGADIAQRNVISGNAGSGIIISGFNATQNVIQNNFIGTDVSGTLTVGNGGSGIFVNSDGNIIGGVNQVGVPDQSDVFLGNIIAGNALSGIELASGDRNAVFGNAIGTDHGGTLNLGNNGPGLRVFASNNTIGGTLPGAGNTIAFNGGGTGAGVFIESGTGNLISANSIYENGGLGIDLNPVGATPNDDLDLDTGANNLQNFPLISDARAGGGNLRVRGELNSSPVSTFTLEFFASPVADLSGHGEGQIYLGSVEVTTDGLGRAPYDVTLPFGVANATAFVVTATATDFSDNTSEFSLAQDIEQGQVADLALTKTGPTITTVDTELVYTVRVTNLGNDQFTNAAPNVIIGDDLPAGVIFVSASVTTGNGRVTVQPTLPGDQRVEAVFDTLADGEFGELEIRVLTTQTGLITNQASVTSDAIDPDLFNNSDSQTTSVNLPIDLGVEILLDPERFPDPTNPAVVVGEELAYLFNVTNSLVGPASGVTLTVTVSADALILQATNFQGGTPTQVVNPDGTTTIIFDLGTIAGFGRAQPLVRVRPGANSTQVVLETSVSALTQANELDINPNNNSDSVAVQVLQAANLSLQLVSSPAEVLTGDTLTYTLDARNAGPSPATNSQLLVNLPAGMTDIQVTVDGLSVVPIPSGPQFVIVDLGTLQPSDAPRIVIRGTVGPAAVGPLVLSAGITSSEVDVVPDDNVVVAVTQLNPADVAVVVLDPPTTAEIGQALTYNIVVINQGPTTANNVVFTNLLPEGAVLTGAQISSGAAIVADPENPRLLLANLGSLPVNTPVSVVLTVVPTVSALLTNVTSATLVDQFDRNPGNNQQVITTAVNAADLEAGITFEGPGGPVGVGDLLTYTIRVRNRGPQTATGVTLSSTIPAGTVLAGASQGSGVTGLIQIGNEIAAGVVDLPVGAEASYQVSFRALAEGTVQITATAGSQRIDPDPANNVVTVFTTVANTAGLLQFAQPVLSVDESAGQAVVTVERIGGTLGAIAVDFATAGGNAVPGVDYTPTSGRLVFQDGQRTATFTVDLIRNGAVTGDRTIGLFLTDVGLGELGPQATAVLVVRDVDVDRVGPRVADLQFRGNARSVTGVILRFDELLDPASATNPANFRLIAAASGRRPGGVVPLAEVAWDPVQRAVLLVPGVPLAAGAFHQVLVVGAGPGGVRDLSGNLLDGDADGVPGGNFLASFARGTNLTYNDVDGDRVNLRLIGSGLIESIRSASGQTVATRITGGPLRHTTVAGSVRRARGGDGMASLGAVSGLGTFAGGAQSRLTTPPFTATNSPFPAATTALRLSRALPARPFALRALRNVR